MIRQQGPSWIPVLPVSVRLTKCPMCMRQGPKCTQTQRLSTAHAGLYEKLRRFMGFDCLPLQKSPLLVPGTTPISLRSAVLDFKMNPTGARLTPLSLPISWFPSFGSRCDTVISEWRAACNVFASFKETPPRLIALP